jgi:hypothetical protein
MKKKKKPVEEKPQMSREEFRQLLLDRAKQPGRYTEFGSILWCGHQFTLAEPLPPELRQQLEEENREWLAQQANGQEPQGGSSMSVS